MSGGSFLLRWLTSAVVAIAIVVVAPVVALIQGAPPVAASANATANRMAGVDFLTENQPISGSAGEFQRIKADGANTVSFDVWWDVPSLTSNAISPVPGITDSDADLTAAAQEARQAGLRVTLTPKFVVGTNGWRGEYNPPNPAMFFSGYQTMVDHYADLAQQTGMTMLYVGSEMIDSDGYLDYWHQVVNSARQHFSGTLSYEEDWREVGRFNFGDAVDVVSISAYFPISSDVSPALSQLEAGWHSFQGADAFSEVAAQALRWGKPIMFGEVGYEASGYAGRNPCCNSTNTTSDAGLQARAYQALLDTFVGQPWWGGVTWWAWNNGDVRSPEGKPAEGLIGTRSVAFPSLVAAPGAGRAAAVSPAPNVTGPQQAPNGAPDGGSLPRLAPPTGEVPAAGGVSPEGAANGRPTAALPDSSSTGPQPGGRAGLVRLRTSHDGTTAGDRLGLTLIGLLAAIVGLAASARLMARTAISRRHV